MKENVIDCIRSSTGIYLCILSVKISLTVPKNAKILILSKHQFFTKINKFLVSTGQTTTTLTRYFEHLFWLPVRKLNLLVNSFYRFCYWFYLSTHFAWLPVKAASDLSVKLSKTRVERMKQNRLSTNKLIMLDVFNLSVIFVAYLKRSSIVFQTNRWGVYKRFLGASESCLTVFCTFNKVRL